MKLVSYMLDGIVEIGALANAERDIVRLQAAQLSASGSPASHFTDMLAFLAGDEAARHAASRAVEFAQTQCPPDVVVPAGSVRLLSPVPRPESIREFMNFEQHVINCARRFGMKPWRARLDNFIERRFGREHTLAFKTNRPWYERPIYYKGNRFSVIGHEMPVVIPRYTTLFDYELEFGIFLSRVGRNIRKEHAHRHIGGYVVFNDFSARDIQGREMGGRLGPSKGKDFDGGNAIGPVLVTPDEIPDPYSLTMTARVNGKEWSRGNSGDMRFRFDDVISYVSQDETLYPGEFFGSGTCSGAQGMGCGLEQGHFLQAGDVIELEVERIGVLRNRVVASEETA